MLKSLCFFIKYFLFWILFFALNRLTFELWNYDKITEQSTLEILKTFIYGAHMDASMAAYFCVIPFFIFIVFWLFKSITYPYKFIKIYTLILIVFTIIFTIIDFNIYTEWGTKLNAKAIEVFITSPNEAMASSASSPIFSTILIGIILFLIGLYLAKKLNILEKQPSSIHHFIIKLPIGLLVLGLTFLAIRGGWGIAPMNPSKVYFSESPIINHSSLNTNWLLLSNYLKKSPKENPYKYFDQSEIKGIIQNLYQPQIDSLEIPNILTINKPNIVFIILESFTADVVEELGGEKNITPAFSSLIKEGLLFENIYSTGDRTDKGMIAILSGFPSQATRSIIKENDKQIKLPSIIQQLANENYKTSFFYGGETEFANFKSYLIDHKVQTLVDAHQYESKDLTSKWGAYDEVTFRKNLEFLKTEKEPFFSTVLTLSNHEPFQLPEIGKFGNNTLENKFRSTSYYTADQILKYINIAKTEKWYQNTLFVLIADHGHRLPKNINDIYVKGRYHIPMLFLGGALKNDFKGQSVLKYGSQTDLAATLTYQLKLPDTLYKYSKNLLNDQIRGFGFYCWDNGFGLVDEEKAISFDPISNKVIFSYPKNISKKQEEEALKDAKAYMQSVYQDYLDY